MRKLLLSYLLLPVIACGTVTPEVAEAPADEVSSDDLSEFASREYDIDGNGKDDLGQSLVIGASDEFGAVFFVEPGPKLPGGIAAGQDLKVVGYGNKEYSSAENGWASWFLAMSEIEIDGTLVWYGIGGLRPGVYEVECATADATIGTLDGWCLLEMDLSSDDMREYLIPVDDGDETCPRRSYHAAFEVWDDYEVTPLGYRISQPDTNCY